MAFEACANYGMNDVIGPVSYGGHSAQKEGWTKPFSEKTAEMLDEQVRKMINIAYERTREILTKHREDVEKVAKLLLEKENITRYVFSLLHCRMKSNWQSRCSEDMVTLLGKRPFSSKDDMDKWLDENRGEKSAPPPLERATSPAEVEDPGPMPVPISKALDDKLML